MASVLASIASQFGVTTDALLEIKETTFDNLRQRALQLASENHWQDHKYLRYEGEGTRLWQIVHSEDLTREFGFALRPLILESGEMCVEMLTRAIVAHRLSRRAIRWESIVNMAIQICSAAAEWERSAEWLARAFKTAGLSKKLWFPRTKPRFLSAFSGWTVIWLRWDEKNRMTDFYEIALRKIRHIIRLTPEETAGVTFPLPTIAEFRERRIISQKRAAKWLNCTPRTIRNYIKKGGLNKTKTGKVCCDDKWTVKMRREYGSALRVM